MEDSNNSTVPDLIAELDHNAEGYGVAVLACSSEPPAIGANDGRPHNEPDGRRHPPDRRTTPG